MNQTNSNSNDGEAVIQTTETSVCEDSQNAPTYDDGSSVNCKLTESGSANVFVVDVDGHKHADANLQAAFLKFKKQKQKEIKSATRKRREVPDEARHRALSDPHHMMELRAKFLANAKKYFGVPYARKYWASEDAEYHSPLFLDCCGLVRRVMRDMRHDFGFRLGPWNQSYMFDTLPITVEREGDMKPGDLVFISAIYNNPKLKKQKHNLTHVEIWLGEGCKTIGARWQKGKVQIFESYMFNATAYHSPKYIFKSLDTWLMGICRSHCPEHTYRLWNEVFVPTKRSIFAVAEHQLASAADEDAEESADSDSDDSESVRPSSEPPQVPRLVERSRSMPVVEQVPPPDAKNNIRTASAQSCPNFDEIQQRRTGVPTSKSFVKVASRCEDGETPNSNKENFPRSLLSGHDPGLKSLRTPSQCVADPSIPFSLLTLGSHPTSFREHQHL